MRLVVIITLIVLQGCYSFRGISIDPEIDYFYIETFNDDSGLLPPGYNEIFTEDFVQKILTDTRLDVSEDKGEIIFSGRFTRFEVRAEDPGQISGNTVPTSLNRLYISIVVDYFNEKTEESWTKKYDEVQDFDANANFTDLEEELMEAITERILERIFIDAFTNW